MGKESRNLVSPDFMINGQGFQDYEDIQPYSEKDNVQAKSEKSIDSMERV